jgi:hypothetical protein
MIKQSIVNKLSFIASIILLINISVIALAENKNDDYINQAGDNKLSLGLELFPYLYQEPNLMRMDGNFYGINGSYSYYLNEDYFLRAEIRLAKGNTKYFSYETGSMKNTPNRLLESRILCNKSLKYSFLDISPFVGFGFRYKGDNSNRKISTTGHTGYLRASNYYYVPVGLSMNYNLQADWSLDILGEYDILLKGRQKSYFNNTLIHSQSKGYGLRSEISLNHAFDKYIFSIGPYINYWKIQSSNIINLDGKSFYEPKNTTREVGIKIKFTF